MTTTILETIVERRKRDVAAARAIVSIEELAERAAGMPAPIDVVARLRADAPMAVMAEIKRASPSKGDIAPEMDAVAQAKRYAEGGAAAISVLTEPTWFKGTLEDMAGVRAALDGMGARRPAVLRKDFVVDEYQVAEARVNGADAVLLIVACLSDSELERLMVCVETVGMTPLVEVATAEEMRRAAAAQARFIGVNNRNLHDFSMDMGRTGRLAEAAPEGALLAALSGISTRADVVSFEEAGAEAVLVGEALMRAADPAATIAEIRGR